MGERGWEADFSPGKRVDFSINRAAMGRMEFSGTGILSNAGPSGTGEDDMESKSLKETGKAEQANIGRRSFVKGVAGAGVCQIVAPPFPGGAEDPPPPPRVAARR